MLPKRLKISGSLKRLAVWAIILLAWEMAFRLIGWADYVFPAPSTIAQSLWHLLDAAPAFGGRPLLQAPLISLLRLAVGFTISIFLGGALGLAMWRWDALDRFFGPLFLGLQTLPSVCWVPLAVLLLGLNESGVLFVLVMGSFFAIAISLRDGLRTIPPIYQRAGLMMGAHGWRLYRYVLLPASLPALVGSLRQGFSFAWRSLMGAELVLIAVNSHGLGFFLHVGRDFNDPSLVVAIMILMVLIGMAADRWFFARLQAHVQARFGLA